MVERLWRNQAWLERHYVDCKLSTLQMGSLAGCSDMTIARWLKRFGIPRRSLKEAYEARWKYSQTRAWTLEFARRRKRDRRARGDGEEKES